MVHIKEMLKADAIRAYGSVKGLADALGYSRAGVQKLPDVLPVKIVFMLEQVSDKTGVTVPRNGKFRRAA